MKVLIIEDDQHTSNLLAATLCANRYAVDAIADGLAGLDLAAQWSYVRYHSFNILYQS